MTKANYTHLALVVDRSGSMAWNNLNLDAQGGINTLIKDQAKLPGKVTTTLFQFDTVYEQVFGPIEAGSAPEYVLTPRGGTALLDAVGRSINETGTWLRNMRESERPSKVLFIIVTDGDENSSHEFTKAKVKEMITEQEARWNWEFMFLGANIDAFSEAQSLGIRAQGTQYLNTSRSLRNVYAGASYAVANAHLHSSATMDSFMPKNVDDETEVGNVDDLLGNTSSTDSSS